eukprot:4572060-Amphidinium_carterae.1
MLCPHARTRAHARAGLISCRGGTAWWVPRGQVGKDSFWQQAREAVVVELQKPHLWHFLEAGL